MEEDAALKGADRQQHAPGQQQEIKQSDDLLQQTDDQLEAKEDELLRKLEQIRHDTPAPLLTTPPPGDLDSSKAHKMLTRHRRWWIPLVVTGAVVPTVAIGGPVAVGMVGFSSSGIVAGSAAAAWQASIGNVAAGSLFASLQSAGATGAVWGMGAAAGASTGAVAGGGTAVGMFARDAIAAKRRGGMPAEEKRGKSGWSVTPQLGGTLVSPLFNCCVLRGHDRTAAYMHAGLSKQGTHSNRIVGSKL